MPKQGLWGQLCGILTLKMFTKLTEGTNYNIFNKRRSIISLGDGGDGGDASQKDATLSDAASREVRKPPRVVFQKRVSFRSADDITSIQEEPELDDDVFVDESTEDQVSIAEEAGDFAICQQDPKAEKVEESNEGSIFSIHHIHRSSIVSTSSSSDRRSSSSSSSGSSHSSVSLVSSSSSTKDNQPGDSGIEDANIAEEKETNVEDIEALPETLDMNESSDDSADIDEVSMTSDEEEEYWKMMSEGQEENKNKLLEKLNISQDKKPKKCDDIKIEINKTNNFRRRKSLSLEDLFGIAEAQASILKGFNQENARKTENSPKYMNDCVRSLTNIAEHELDAAEQQQGQENTGSLEDLGSIEDLEDCSADEPAKIKDGDHDYQTFIKDADVWKSEVTYRNKRNSLQSPYPVRLSKCPTTSARSSCYLDQYQYSRYRKPLHSRIMNLKLRQSWAGDLHTLHEDVQTLDFDESLEDLAIYSDGWMSQASLESMEELYESPPSSLEQYYLHI